MRKKNFFQRLAGTIKMKHSLDEEEYEGRDWKRILIGVFFVLMVVVLWYVIEYAAR